MADSNIPYYYILLSSLSALIFFVCCMLPCQFIYCFMCAFIIRSWLLIGWAVHWLAWPRELDRMVHAWSDYFELWRMCPIDRYQTCILYKYNTDVAQNFLTIWTVLVQRACMRNTSASKLSMRTLIDTCVCIYIHGQDPIATARPCCDFWNARFGVSVWYRSVLYCVS